MVRLPVPKNKVLLFTLVGAVLTGVVAFGLAYPDAAFGDDAKTAMTTQDGATSTDAPAPNESFTPTVGNTGYGEEYEEHEEEEYEDGHEEEEHEREYEDYEDEEDEYSGEYDEGREYEEDDD